MSACLEAEAVDRLNLYLIKPSKYDDEGYVIRYWKGVLPSNTLACLYGLTEDIRERKVLGDSLAWHIQAIDETVQKVPIDQIIRQSRQKRSRTVVCLVGVQSNQFPRASDLALEFRKAGIAVLIGGFHVSGILSTLKELSPELERLQQAGVTLVAGEAEGRWEGLLRDALHDTLQPIYNYVSMPPDFSCAPMPRMPENLKNRYAVKHFATMDCGRGCPYQCSFCTVINVQGRKMRFRSLENIFSQIRENYRKYGIYYYFFTDDNFCRHKNWEAILDGLIEIREKEGIRLTFMMQVDTRSHLIPGFIEKAKRAGCTQVFIGMESLNPENLKAAAKNQNEVGDFKKMIDLYHASDIATHLAYIIGFPHDTSESVRSDLKQLMELGGKQASFFMLTPLPGSEDYRKFHGERRMLDADLSNYDTFHSTFRHSRMTGQEWKAAYDSAWTSFYSMDNMKRILRNTSAAKYWDVFMNFVWYKYAVEVEKGHPMIHGFVRFKSRAERSPVYAKESLWAYGKRRLREMGWMLRGMLRLAFEFEEVWLATRRRAPFEEKVLREFSDLRQNVAHWRQVRLSDLQAVYQKAAATFHLHHGDAKTAPVQVPSRFSLWLKKWDVFSDFLTTSRFPLKAFWREVGQRFRQGRLDKIRPHQILFMSWVEGVLFTRFFVSLLRNAVNS